MDRLGKDGGGTSERVWELAVRKREKEGSRLRELGFRLGNCVDFLLDTDGG